MAKAQSQLKQFANQNLSLDMDDDKAVNEFIKKEFEKRKTRMYEFMRQWYIQIAFFAGHQNLRWNNITNTLEEPLTPTWRQRLVINLLQPTARTTVSKLIKQRPYIEVVPATGDTEDIVIASKNSKIMSFYWDYLNIGSKLIDALFWMVTTGNGFLKPSWDSSAGEYLEISPSDLLTAEDLSKESRARALKLFKRYFNIEDSQKIDMKKIYKLPIGEPRLDVVSPFEITPPSRCTKLEDARWLIQSRVYHIDELKEMFGHNADDLTEGTFTDSDLQLIFEERLLDLTPRHGGFLGGTNPQRKDYVLVHEFWHKPTRYYPDGIHYVFSQDKVLNTNNRNPYNHKLIPYVHLKEIPVPGRFWGTCVVEQSMDIQRDYNKTKSQISENRNTMVGGKWIVPNTSGISDAQITSDPFEIIKYNFPFKPELANMPTLPTYVERTLDFNRRDLEDISGQHEVTKAQVPGQVRSGAAIAQLQEADDTRLGTVSQEIDFQISRASRMLLNNISQFVKEERIIRIVGTEASYSSMKFTGEDLTGQNNKPNVSYFDVKVKMFSRLSMSRSSQLNLINTFLERGLLNPETDRELVFHLTELGDISETVSGTRKAKAKQLNEIERIVQGETISAAFWELHETHIRTLRDFMNSAEFDNMEEITKNQIIEHYKQHLELQAQEQILPEILMAKESMEAKAQIEQELQQKGINPNVPDQQGAIGVLDQGFAGGPAPAGGPVPGPTGPPAGGPGSEETYSVRNAGV